jgi:hypothetical protein
MAAQEPSKLSETGSTPAARFALRLGLRPIGGSPGSGGVNRLVNSTDRLGVTSRQRAKGLALSVRGQTGSGLPRLVQRRYLHADRGGVQVAVCVAGAGHSSEAMTARVYVHEFEAQRTEEDDRAAVVLEEFVG